MQMAYPFIHYLYVVKTEKEGFEPSVPCGTPVFKTGALNQLCDLSLTCFASITLNFNNVNPFFYFLIYPTLCRVRSIYSYGIIILSATPISSGVVILIFI